MDIYVFGDLGRALWRGGDMHAQVITRNSEQSRLLIVLTLGVCVFCALCVNQETNNHLLPLPTVQFSADTLNAIISKDRQHSNGLLSLHAFWISVQARPEVLTLTDKMKVKRETLLDIITSFLFHQTIKLEHIISLHLCFAAHA